MANKNKVYQYIIDALERGTVPWRSPYIPMTSGYGHKYSGINKLVLNIRARSEGFTSPVWFTFKKASALGASVQKGQKGTAIFYYAKGKYKDDDDKEKSYMSQRIYHVFNKEQIDWDPEMDDYDNFMEPKEFQGVSKAVDICSEYLFREKLKVKNAPGSAYYSPKEDFINVPKAEALVRYDDYYPTLFHEMAHSTGHKTRLARPGITESTTFGDHKYSEEELVAEMTSAYLCGDTNWNVPDMEQSAAYIDNWLKVIGGNKDILQRASTQAEKAYNYIIGGQDEH